MNMKMTARIFWNFEENKITSKCLNKILYASKGSDTTCYNLIQNHKSQFVDSFIFIMWRLAAKSVPDSDLKPTNTRVKAR